jgi:hypothetical protein
MAAVLKVGLSKTVRQSTVKRGSFVTLSRSEVLTVDCVETTSTTTNSDNHQESAEVALTA